MMTPCLSPSAHDIPSRGGYLSSRQLAERLGFTARTIAKKRREGRIHAIKILGRWRYDPSEMGVDMGRRGKTGAGGIIRKPNSPFYYVLLHGKAVSTKTADLRMAQAMRLEMQAKELRGMVEEIAEFVSRPVDARDEEPKAVSSGGPREQLNQTISTVPLFKSVLERYLSSVSPSKSRSGASDQTNAMMPRLFFDGCNPEHKVYRVDEVNVQAVYKYQDWRGSIYSVRKKQPVSAATINREVALIKHVLKKCVRWGYIDRSPLPKGEVEGVKGEVKRDRYITDKEFRNIIDHLGNITVKTMCESLYHTTQRANRIFTLQWRQIDLDNRTVKFEQVSRNKRAAEVVYINDSLYAILQTLSEERKRKAVISPFVFCHKNGKPYGSIRSAWEKACKAAGVEDARIHDIRHKSITDMARAGVSKQMIQKAVGHSQGSTTERYTHLQVDDVRAAFEALG